jgi:hypothetical protein
MPIPQLTKDFPSLNDPKLHRFVVSEVGGSVMGKLTNSRSSICRHKDINYFPWCFLIFIARKRKTGRKQKNRNHKD